MATNPLYNTNDSPNNATQPSKAVNDSQVFVNRNRNTFDLSYFNFKTQRFGQYEPFFVMEGVPGDTIPLSSSHNVRSLPMKSPFLSSLTLSKDYFMIPMQAILPNTWEMIYANPASGDDVPEDANCLWDFFNLSFLANLGSSVALTAASSIKILFVLESLFSSASLPAQLGYAMQETLKSSVTSFDHVFNEACKDLLSSSNMNITFKFPDGSTTSLAVNSVPGSVYIDYLRQNYVYIVSVTNGAYDITALSDWFFANEYFLQVWSGVKFNIELLTTKLVS